MTPDHQIVDAAAVGVALDHLTDALAARRRPDGSWAGHLPSSAVSTGAVVMALLARGEATDERLVADAVDWLRRVQNDDGGWGDAPWASTNLNATAIAVAAMATARIEGTGEALSRGRSALDDLGGLTAVSDKARCSLKTVCEFFLAEAGLLEPDRLALLPHEIGLLPARVWRKLSFTVPGLMAWGTMQARAKGAGPVRKALRRWAEPRALAYLRDIHRHESGDPDRPGGIEESALMCSIVLWGLARAGVGDDLATAYAHYLRATVREDGSWPIDRDIEHSVTTYLTQGLLTAPGALDLTPTITWIRDGQRDQPFAATGVPAGGWGWSRPSGWPDVDDTAGAVLCLALDGAAASRPAVGRGADFLTALQNRNGSWSCFARNSSVTMDAPCSVMTAHTLLALQAAGLSAEDQRFRRALRWLATTQSSDGHFTNIWFRGRTAGTARVLHALRTLGQERSAMARSSACWLVAVQRANGSWDDGMRNVARHGSTDFERPGTVEETAWAVLALAGSADPHERVAAERGVAWMLGQQRADGLFTPSPIGIYFLGLTYHCDHVADAYALQALHAWAGSQVSR